MHPAVFHAKHAAGGGKWEKSTRFGASRGRAVKPSGVPCEFKVRSCSPAPWKILELSQENVRMSEEHLV